MSDRFIPPGVFKSTNPDGQVHYTTPGPPVGGGLGKMHGIFDVIACPDKWLDRATGSLAIENADTHEMMKWNARANRKLGPMKDWKDLWGKESGKICLFISCGPSLTDSLPEIAELLQDKDKYFTLGINRAFKAIDLDYFVVSDRRCQDDWVDRATDKTTLIAATTARSSIIEKFVNRYFGESFLARTDEGNAPLRVGLGITMCDALHAAYKLGAEEVWLYGADFAMSGKEQEDMYMLEKYYFDLPSYMGLAIRPEKLREMQPVVGIHGKLCFINYELLAYCCYCTAMCMMIEESGGVPVRNKSKQGILYWGSDAD